MAYNMPPQNMAPQPYPQPYPPAKTGMSTGAKVGIVVGIIAVIAVVVGLVLFFTLRGSDSATEAKPAASDSASTKAKSDSKDKDKDKKDKDKKDKDKKDKNSDKSKKTKEPAEDKAGGDSPIYAGLNDDPHIWQKMPAHQLAKYLQGGTWVTEELPWEEHYGFQFTDSQVNAYSGYTDNKSPVTAWNGPDWQKQLLSSTDCNFFDGEFRYSFNGDNVFFIEAIDKDMAYFGLQENDPYPTKMYRVQ